MPSLFHREPQPPEVRPLPSAGWSPLPVPGARQVEARVLVSATELTVTMLRLAPGGLLPDLAADHETEVVCLEGSGFTAVDGIAAELAGGQGVHWPAGRPHRLWTEAAALTVLVVEHPRPYRP